MGKWKWFLVCLLVLGCSLQIYCQLKVDTRWSSAASGSSQSTLENYLVDLEPKRERCYNGILLLGTRDEEQLEILKMNLKDYLYELSVAKSSLHSEEKSNSLLNHSIELDYKMIESVIKTIETKNEYYLLDISEKYLELVKYQHQLKE